MLLFAEGPTIVVGWETGVAIATAIAGTASAALKLIINYHTAKDAAHREQVNGIVKDFREMQAEGHEECRENQQVLIGVVKDFHAALDDLKSSIPGTKP